MLLDTSAWIELLQEGKNTNEIKAILLEETCYTSIVSIAEITNWAAREKRDPEPMVEGITKLSTIIPLDKSIAMLAGKLNPERKKVKKKWGIMDSFVLATGMLYSLEILSKDTDFDDLPSAKILPK